MLERVSRVKPRVWAIAGGIFGLLIVVWVWWLPHWVLARANTKLRSLGLEAEASGASVGWFAAHLHSVRIQAEDEGAAPSKPLLEAERISVEVSAGLQPTRVVIRGARAQIATTDAGVARVLKRLRARKAQAGPRGSGARLEVSIDGIEAAVRDKVGPLLEVQCKKLGLAGEVLALDCRRIQVGAAPGDVVELYDLKVQGERRNGRFAIRTLESKSGSLRWGSVHGQTLERLRALREELRDRAAPVAQPAASTVPVSTARASSPRHPWTADAQLRMRGLGVIAKENDGSEQAILSGLDVSVEARGDGLHAAGKGDGPSGGKLGWDLTLWPDEARVEGKVQLIALPVALFAPALPPLPWYELERATVDASLELQGQGLARVLAKGSLAVRGIGLASDALAHAPLGPFDFGLRGAGAWIPAQRTLELESAQVELGAIRVETKGVLAWSPERYRVDLSASMPRTDCQAVLASVPSGVLDELANAKLGGKMGAKIDAHVDSQDLDATKLDFDFDDQCKFTNVPESLNLARFEQPFIHRVLEPDGTTFEMETGPGSPAWTPIELISPFMIQAVVAHEDGRFFSHHGFAEAEIGVALSRNLKAHAFRFGASTITMQLVKNVFLHREKVLSRKVQEAFIVWWLEQHWDKRKILELYLNVIEYGPSVYGIRNAAWHYFGTIPMNLTPAQAAYLATILPSPKSTQEHFEKGTISDSMKNRVGKFLEHMHARQRIDDEALAFGLEELKTFKFYNPNEPPPVPVQIRGSAQPPPFGMAARALDVWDTFESPLPEEDGSFTH